MGLMTSRHLALLTLLAGLAAPSRAEAYRTAADDLGRSVPVGRSESTVQVLLSTELAPGLDETTLLPALDVASAAWSLPCSPLEILVLGTSTRPASTADGLTSVTVVTSGWAERGYDAAEAANTELRFSDEGDRLLITDADIFLNADTIDWTSPDAPDLAAVLVHELGHAAFGLAHPCGEPSTIACTDAIRDASLMHPAYQAGAVVPRADDVAGACALQVEAGCDRVTCGAATWCDRGRCVPVETCADGTSCDGGTCAIAGAAAGMCTSVGGEGAACAVGDDCESRLCLLGTAADRSAVSYCTHVCAVDGDCAASQRCRLVDDAHVCAPPPPAGCAVSSRHGGPSSLLLLSIVLACLRRRARLGALP